MVNNRKLLNIFFIVLCLFTATTVFAQQTYVVKVGETLSSIVEAQTSPPPPLYGEGGRLETVLKLNPNISDPNDIRVGDVIILGGIVSNNRLIESYEGQKRSLLKIEVIKNPLELMTRFRPKQRYTRIQKNILKPSRAIASNRLIKKINQKENIKKAIFSKIIKNEKGNLNDLSFSKEPPRPSLKKEESRDYKKVVKENKKLKADNEALIKNNKELKEQILEIKREPIKHPLVELEKINNERKLSSTEQDLTQSEKNTSNLKKNKLIEEDKKIAFKDEPLLDDDPGSLEFGIGWGPTFYLHNQLSALGTAQLGTLYLNNIEFFTTYERDDFKLIMRLGRYSYNYDDGISSSSTPITTFTVDSYINDYIFGLSFEQQPLLKNVGGKISVITDTVILPRFGHFWDIELSRKVETRFQFMPVVNFSAGGFSSDPSIEFKNHSGFGVDIDTRLIRRLNSSKDLKIYYFWDNGISYRSYQRSSDWGAGAQSFESTHTNFNSTIGISIRFDD